MARINGSGFKMNKSPLTKNIFKGREGYDPAARRAKLKSDVQGFVGGIKKGVKAVDNKLQRVGKFLSSESIRDRKSKTSSEVIKKTTTNNNIKNATKNNPTDKEIKVKTTNNLTLGGNKNKDIVAPKSGRIRKGAADKSLAGDNANWLTSGNYALNKKTGKYVETKVSVKKPKTTDLSKTTGVKAPKKAKATAKQQGVLEKQIQKTNKNKPKTKATVKQQGVLEKQITKTNANKTKTKATVKNQGVLEKAITKPKKATVTSKPTSKKPTTTKSKGGRKAGESQYQYSIRMAKANRKLKNSIKTSKKNKTTKKVDLTKKKGLGPRA